MIHWVNKVMGKHIQPIFRRNLESCGQSGVHRIPIKKGFKRENSVLIDLQSSFLDFQPKTSSTCYTEMMEQKSNKIITVQHPRIYLTCLQTESFGKVPSNKRRFIVPTLSIVF